MWGKIGFEFDWWDLCKSYSVRDGCVLSGCCCGSRSVSLPDFYLIFLSSAIPLYFFCPFQISLSSPVLFPLWGFVVCSSLSLSFCPSTFYPPISPPSFLSRSATACMTVSICLHDCTFAHLFHSPSQISLCLSSSDNLPGGRWRGGGALAEPKSYWHLGEARQNHSENHLVKWFSFTTFCSLPHPSPHVCNSWSAGRAALNVVGESWQRRSKEIRPFARASLICSLFSAFLSVFID